MNIGDEDDAPEVPAAAENALADAPDAPEAEDTEDAPAPAAPAYDPEIVAEAKRYGWKAPDEWHGERPPGYIEDPERYLDTPGVLRRQQRELRQELERVRTATVRSMAEQRKHLEAERQREIERIGAEIRRAAEVGDVDAVDRLRKEEREIIAPPREEPQQPQVDPLVARYQAQNEWAADPVKWAAAVSAVDAAINAGQRFGTTAEQLAYAERAVRQTYPHWFNDAAPAPQRAPLQRVDAGGSPKASGRSDWDRLDGETRRDLDMAIKSGVYPDRKAAIKAYKAAYPEEFR